MWQHLPILLVIAPLLAAPICTLLPAGRWPWVFASTVSWSTLLIAVMLLQRVQQEGVIIYQLGGWPAPWGIEYRLDAVNALLQLVVTALAAVILPFAGPSVSAEVRRDRHSLFYAAVLLLIAGLLGICATGDAFNVFVFLEISSLSTYALIAMGRDRRALTAAYRYLIMGTLGATFYLIGIGLLYALTGTLNMQDLALRLPAVTDTRTAHTAVAFVITGVCLKLALFPLHLWLPNAYTYAPSAISALIAATATKVAVYLLLRFTYGILGIEFSFGNLQLDQILLALALIGIVSASLVAIHQNNAKRLLAYSSVAQIGYMILGMSMISLSGLTASLLHLFNHALMKGALFMALGCVALRVRSTEIEAMRGLGRRMPWTMAAFVVGGLSLIGMPLTVGFVSKWYLIQGALELGWWPVVILILIGSLMALVYVWRIVEVAYFQPNESGLREEAPLLMLLPTWTLVLANLYFGIDTRLTIGMAQRAASILMGVTP